MDLIDTGDVGNFRSGDALVQGFSLFSCGSDCSCGGYDMPHFCTYKECVQGRCSEHGDGKRDFQENFLSKNVTTVTLVKLDTFALYKEYRDCEGLHMLCKVRKKVEGEIAQYLEDKGLGKAGTNWQIKTFFSLGMYDLIIFLSTIDPNHASDARLHFLGSCPEVLFTTSFGIFDYKSNSDEEKWKEVEERLKDESGENIKVGFRFRGAIRRGFDIDAFEHQLSILLNANSANPVVSGNVPGDEDFAINYKKVELINILKLYRKDGGSYLHEQLVNCYGDRKPFKEVFRRSHSVMAFFNHHQGYREVRLNDDKKRKKLQKLYADVVTLYSKLKMMNQLPEFSEHHIEYVLYTCDRLLDLRSHRNTSYRFLLNLEYGLKRHESGLKRSEDKNDLNASQSDELRGSLVEFVTSLALALKDAVDVSGLHMERLSELYASTTYYKPIASLLQMTQDMFGVLGEKSQDLQLFLNISREADIRVVLYFYDHKGRPSGSDPFLASIDIPSPVFFDLSESYHYVLHEIGHLLQTGSLSSGKEAFKSMILDYITICIISRISDREGKCPIFKKNVPNYIDVLAGLNDLKGIKFLDAKNDKEKFPAFVASFGEALNEAANGLEIPNSDIELEILRTLQWFQDRNLSQILASFSLIFREARADVLMCEMSKEDFGLKEYIEFWNKHFCKFGTKPLEDDITFILRICLVAEHFVINRNQELPESKLEISGFNMTEYYDSWKPVWGSFVDYVMKWENTNGAKVVEKGKKPLFDKLKNDWKLPQEKSPTKLDHHEQVALHIGNWFRWAMQVEDDIDKLPIK